MWSGVSLLVVAVLYMACGALYTQWPMFFMGVWVAAEEDRGEQRVPARPQDDAQARLRVMVTLSALGEGDEIAFPSLKDLLAMTAGNLSVHLTKLEEAGYVRITKTHRGRTPVTYVSMTTRGRLALEDYTKAIRSLLDSAGGNP